MKITNLIKYDGEKTKAFFEVETEEGMVVKGFKLVEGSNGLFMCVPSEFSQKDGKYYPRVYIPIEFKDQLEKDAIKEYGGDLNDSDNGPF